MIKYSSISFRDISFNIKIGSESKDNIFSKHVAEMTGYFKGIENNCSNDNISEAIQSICMDFNCLSKDISIESKNGAQPLSNLPIPVGSDYYYINWSMNRCDDPTEFNVYILVGWRLAP